MKKALLMLIIAIAAFSLYAQPAAEVNAKPETFIFTDSLDRQIELPSNLEKIVPSGNLAQMVLYSVAPEKIVGWSSKLSNAAKEYFLQDTVNLPVFGTFYGKKANLNKEALIYAGPEVVIDMGEIKGSKEAMTSDLDKLSSDIAIPVVFIENYLDNTPDAYRTLGKLLDKEERAEKLASYSEKALEMAASAREKIATPVTVYYSSSEDGLEAIPEGSFHGEVIEKVGGKNIVPSSFTNKNGSSVSMEQLYLWNPDVILLSNKAAYDNATTSDVWANLDAVKNKRVYLVPTVPYSFIDSPPANNRIIGMYWLGNILYPELFDVDVVKEVQDFYSLFYSHDLTADQAKTILGN